MIGFFIKKNFCDGWDNMLFIVVCNLIPLAAGVGGYFAFCQFSAFAQATGNDSYFYLFAIPTALILLFLVNCCFSSVSRECSRIANFASVEYKNIFEHFFDDWKDSLIFTIVITLAVFIALFIIPWYLEQGNMIGIFISALIAWMCVLAILALQWYFPLKSQLKGGFKKTFKKCFLILFDNTGFTIFLFLYNLLLAAMSVFLAFILPGFAGLLMSGNNALHLRMYKYDWMEEHPGLTPKEIRKLVPWDELLAEDKEAVGPRSFRSFIFPWKD